MSEADLKALVEATLDVLRDRLGLQPWTLLVRYDRLPDGEPGNIMIQAPYERATITLDPSQIESQQEALHTLRHELIHVMIWPMHGFSDAITPALPGGGMSASEFEAWRFFLERMVKTVEDLLDRNHVAGLGPIPALLELL